jgi:hypothetical protein
MIRVLEVKTAEAPYAASLRNIREAGAALHASEEGGE